MFFNEFYGKSVSNSVGKSVGNSVGKSLGNSVGNKKIITDASVSSVNPSVILLPTDLLMDKNITDERFIDGSFLSLIPSVI